MDALLQQRDSIAAAVSEAKAEVGTVFAQDKPLGLDLPQWQSRQSLAAAQLPAAATSLSMCVEVGIRRCAGEERGASTVRQMRVVCCEAGGCTGGGGLVGRSVGEPSLHLRTARSDVEAKMVGRDKSTLLAE